MTVTKKIRFTWHTNNYHNVTEIDITKMQGVWDHVFISKNEGVVIDYQNMKFLHYKYGKTGEYQQTSPFTTVEFVNERADESSIKNPLIEKIRAKGFPVVTCFDFQDSVATIHAKSETEIETDDYGSSFVEPDVSGDPKSLTDLTIEGLTNLHKNGIRPEDGDEYTEILEYL